MTRTCATALALVNWKGVFYERYLLDRHVTALEGANGAGKTTVMIAAYVVLMPDLSRLRFTNLGETAATGGDRGLYGRLGEAGRPSYAAMELSLGNGDGVIAGVQLVRKSEPSLELTPFLVTDVKLDGSLKELLLVSNGDHDEVPELEDVRAAVHRLGGKLVVFGSAKDYFAALFDRGINPLRLATDEERSKLHDMLRTSMTGGISRALTSELRSFLLREESNLSDTLVRMRANLEACRRTRAEVAEARSLEREISAIHDAGQRMFDACAAATRSAALEAEQRIRRAEEKIARGEADLSTLTREEARLSEERVRVSTRLGETAVALEELSKRLARAVNAHAVATRLAEAERARLASTELSDKSDAECKRQEHLRSERRDERDRARDAYERATRGLGDLQAGLDELLRRAHAQRTARSRLGAARELLGAEALDESALDATLADVRAKLAANDTQRASLERDAALTAVRSQEYADAVLALREIVGDRNVDAESEPPFAAARRELQRLDALEHVAAERAQLEEGLWAARDEARLADEARARATSLGVELGSDPAANLQSAVTRADDELRAHEDGLRTHTTEAASAARRREAASKRAHELTQRLAEWETIAPCLARLEERCGEPVRTVDAVARMRARWATDLDAIRRTIQTEEARRVDREREAKALAQDGGDFDPRLLLLRDKLGADLLATRFEDSSGEEAPWLEAALGPLARALVVPDPGTAAEKLAQIEDAPATVWLVAADDVTEIALAARRQIGSSEAVDVVVEEGRALRVTRKPERPVLGRQARQRRREELLAEAHEAADRIATALDEARSLDALIADADRLFVHAALVAAGDPSTARDEALAEAAREERLEAEERERARVAEEHAAACRTRLQGVRALIGDAKRWTKPNVAELEGRLAHAREAEATLARVSKARGTLSATIDALRHPPESPEALAASDDARRQLDSERDRLYAAERALVDVSSYREALSWPDLDAAIADTSASRSAIDAQHASARAALEAAEEALGAAERAWEQARSAWQEHKGERAARESECERLRRELEAEGGDEALRTPRETIARELEARTEERDELSGRERELEATLAVTRERRTQASLALETARHELDAVARAAEPVTSEWSRFKTRCDAAGLTIPPLEADARSTNDLLAEARAERALLLTRLEHARGGADGKAAVQAALERADERASEHVEAWCAARAWVMRRLPTQFADVASPSDALGRLRADLATLEDRVRHHEMDLRGTSEDVARGIDVQLRKTAARVRRLNRDLSAVSFGSIAAVRVHVKRVERMDLVLRALRGGEVQELLFQSDLPFEEALAEVLRRYGGGGRAGAQRVLDYREYLELVVEIQRKASPPNTWEVASPTRLSTGEAIGVGAALMMVILTEWERDSNLLRTDKPTGTLRFLFLDEANRLSPDNLTVLFDLCRVLDLQLLVAAPEVARAHGNTTYRLVRRVDSSGREEVLVSGRRAIVDSSTPRETADAPSADTAPKDDLLPAVDDPLDENVDAEADATHDDRTSHSGAPMRSV